MITEFDSEHYKNIWRSDGGIVIPLSAYYNNSGGKISVGFLMNISSDKIDLVKANGKSIFEV